MPSTAWKLRVASGKLVPKKRAIPETLHQWCARMVWIGTEESAMRDLIVTLTWMPEFMSIMASIWLVVFVCTGVPVWTGQTNRVFVWHHLCGDVNLAVIGDECGTFRWLAPISIGFLMLPLITKCAYSRYHRPAPD